MVDPEQLALIKQGVEAWNSRRRENPGIRVDLARADLVKADLGGADLRNADLGPTTDLANPKNRGSADFTDTRDWPADLRGADLRLAKLQGANLQGARLIRADLRGAKLQGADISGANLSSAENLAQQQLDEACGNAGTLLPEGLSIKICDDAKLAEEP